MAQAAAVTKKKLETFEWEGVDRKGKRIKGQMDGASSAFINAALRRQGVKPVNRRMVASGLKFEADNIGIGGQ